MLGYLFLDFKSSSEFTIFLELRSRKIVRFSEQIMSADKYPSIFSRQMETIVYIFSRQMETIVYIFSRQKKTIVYVAAFWCYSSLTPAQIRRN